LIASGQVVVCYDVIDTVQHAPVNVICFRSWLGAKHQLAIFQFIVEVFLGGFFLKELLEERVHNLYITDIVLTFSLLRATCI
jgi:hypothetical protein